MQIALAILAVSTVWLFPLVVSCLVSLVYDPVVTIRKRGTGRVIEHCTKVYYSYRWKTTVVKKDVCPLCKRSNSRCCVIVNPVTGYRIHFPRGTARAYFNSILRNKKTANSRGVL